MNNVSFKAKLVVDKALYNKMPEGTPENYTEDLVSKYQEFLNHRVIKKVTEGDTVELYKAPHRGGFALGIKYTSDELEEPIDTGIFTNKKIPEVKLGSLIFQTLQILVVKSGIEQKFFEHHKKTFQRALEALYSKAKEQEALQEDK